jgi:hypothetical protein
VFYFIATALRLLKQNPRNKPNPPAKLEVAEEVEERISRSGC